ncbi:MAG TPA: hypothetical protein EYH34_01195 [Planctomycetes bacterium]|nr:hypothetical protein [Planctomycetota bacterium]
MIVHTTRFGPVVIRREDILHFPEGLLGFSDCRDWVILADTCNDAVAWMQSVDRQEVALPVVSPRRFVPDYQIRVARKEIEPLQLDDVALAQVVVILGKSDGTLTLNLKAPVILNLQRRLGRQVITNGDLPVRYELELEAPAQKKIA